MTHVKSIWTYLKGHSSQYQFEPDLLCVICGTLLRNAYSGPCGCRYCYECISRHLSGTEMYCPGNLPECQQEVLILNINTNKDPAINRKIVKMIIKCPNESCQFTDELGNIERHMEGCNRGGATQEMVSDTKLLLETVKDVKDELQQLKEEMKKLQENKEFCSNTFAFFKVNIDGNQMQIWKLEENQNELCSQIKETNKKLSLLTIPMTLSGEIENLIKKYSDLENSIEEMKKVIKEDYKKSDEDTIKKTPENPFNPPKVESSFSILPNLPIEKDIAVKFKWKFDQLNEKVKEAMTSKKKEFFSNIFQTSKDGYQLCLKLQFDVYSSGGSKYPIYPSLCVMKGKSDGELFWPFEYDVTFELINPCKNKVHTSQTIYNAYSITHPGRSRPVGNINLGLGCFLMDLDEILYDPNWKKEDKFFINCIISRNKR